MHLHANHKADNIERIFDTRLKENVLIAGNLKQVETDYGAWWYRLEYQHKYHGKQQ